MSVSIIEFAQPEACYPEAMPKRRVQVGMNLRDALQVARDLGCQISEVNSRDYAVWHPVLGGEYRPAVVSIGRKDASRHLITVLKKIESRIKTKLESEKSLQKQREKAMAAQSTLKGGLGEPLNLRLADNGSVKESQPEASVEKDAPKPSEQWVGVVVRSHHASSFFRDMLIQVHFQHHCPPGELMPFEDCDNPLCVKGRGHIDAISDLRDELRTAERLLTEAAEQPKPPPPPAEPAAIKEAPPPPEPAKPDRRNLLDFNRFIRHLGESWAGSPQGLSRLTTALRAAYRDEEELMLEAVRGYRDWHLMSELVCSVSAPAGDRSYVGPAAFDRALRHLTEASRKFQRGA